MSPFSSEQGQPHPASKSVVLWMAMLGGFLTPFMGSAVNIALPSIGREFSLDALGLNWVATAYLLSAAMFLLPFGKLGGMMGFLLVIKH